MITAADGSYLSATTWDDHTVNGGTLVLLVYLVNAAKVNSWNVSTYNSENVSTASIVRCWTTDAIWISDRTVLSQQFILIDACSYHILKWVLHFEDNLFILYGVDEDLKNRVMCDFSYDAQCSHSLSLDGVTLLCSMSHLIEDKLGFCQEAAVYYSWVLQYCLLIIVLPEEQVVTIVSAARVIYVVNTAQVKMFLLLALSDVGQQMPFGSRIELFFHNS
ncbi:hypothetical protein Tco_1188402 [Tanacetum coccineum]